MFRELTTPLIAVNPTTSYALGWAVYDWNGLRVVEHNGGSEGISAISASSPKSTSASSSSPTRRPMR